MSEALDALMTAHGAAGAPAAPDALDTLMSSHGAITPDFRSETKASDSPSWLTLAGDVLAGVRDNLNPLPALKALYDGAVGEFTKAQAAATSGHPVSAVAHNLAAFATPMIALPAGIAKAQWDQFVKAKDAYTHGRLSEALGHTLAGVVPVAGPIAANAAEEIGTGDPETMAHGVGGAAVALAPSALKYGKEVAQTGSLVPTPAAVAAAPPLAVRVPAIAPNANPQEVAAVDFGNAHGIPVDAGTASGNAVVRGAQRAAEHTSLSGAYLANKGAQEEATAFTRTGREFAGRANASYQGGPTPGIAPGSAVSTDQAGAGLRSSLDRVIKRYTTEANQAYDTFRQEAAAPAQRQTVTNAQEGRLPGGGTVQVPVSQTMQMPVDLRAAKAALKPVYDDLVARWPIARQQASPGLKALENLVHADDYAPAVTVEANLSAVKALARDAGGAAKLAVRELSDAVETSVGNASPTALKALEAGRAATKAKYEAVAVLDQLRDEPVAAFRQATLKHDAGIGLLNDVARVAGPTVLRDVGRAWLDNVLDLATQEGGFDHRAKLFAEWEQLGTKTKRLLFRNQALVGDLDQFFQLAKMAANNPNPSGSAYVGGLIAHGYLFKDPVSFASWEIGAGALAKLLRNPTAAKALTRGFSVPLNNQAAAATAAGEILKVAGDSAVRVPTAAADRRPKPPTTTRR